MLQRDLSTIAYYVVGELVKSVTIITEAIAMELEQQRVQRASGRIVKKHSFTRKEIALLLDMISFVKLMDPISTKGREAHGLTDSKLRQMYFKLYRIL